MAARTAAFMGAIVLTLASFGLAHAEEEAATPPPAADAVGEAAPEGSAAADDANAPAEKTEPPAEAKAADSTESTASKSAADAREKVGRPPEEPPQRPTVTTLTEVGGVLTPKGTLRFEPSVEFTHTSLSRFNVNGFEVADSSVLIGTFEAFRADRDSVTSSITTRYGITNRFEIEVGVPLVWRNERLSNTIPGPNGITITDSTRAFGLGDIEFGAHYQLNSGLDGIPYLVANLRVKSNSGQSPFQVDRDLLTGLEDELPTGTGFWGVNPSITLISRQDPAVFFANLGYVLNLERDVDSVLRLIPTVTDFTVERARNVDPGDAITGSVGMGLAVNQDFSFNIGFGYTFIRPTESEVTRDTITTVAPLTRTLVTLRQQSSDFQAGSVLFGFGYRFSQNLATSVDIAIGATDDAPDFRINLRVPFTIPVGSIL